MKKQKTTDVYFNQTVNCLVENLSERVKYTKILLLNSEEFNYFELKQKLEEKQIYVIEIVLDSKKEIDLFTISQVLFVNEDIRAVLTIEPKFITIAKYIAQIKRVPCYIFCQGVIARSHCLEIYIKNKQHIDKFGFFQQLNLHIANDEKGVENSLCTLICDAVCVLDYVLIQKLTGEIVDYKAIGDFFQTVSKSIESLIKNENDEFIKRVFQVDLFVNELKTNCLPSFEVYSLLMGGATCVQQKACVCKKIINVINGLIKVKGKNKVVNVDYSLRALELSTAFNLDRLQMQRTLLSQIKQLKVLDVGELTCEVKPIISLGTKLISLVEKNKSLRSLTLKEQMAIDLSGDTYLGINCMTAVRELLK